MDTQYLRVVRRNERGAIRPVTVAIIAILAAIAVAAWLLIVRPYQEQQIVAAGGLPATHSGSKAPTAEATTDLQAMDVDQLLTEASKALKAQRLVAPAGSNAFELYLRVLARQPGNPVATSALRETFPYAATVAEQAVNAGNFDEAQREIGLLAKADPANYTLTILRSKLDAQRKLASQQQQHAQDAQKAAQVAATQKAAMEKAATEQAAAKQVEQQRQVAEQAKAKAPASAPAQQAAAETTVAHAAPAAAAAFTDAVLVKSARPTFPSAALRAGQSGWVVVGFTVTADGRTTGVHVISAMPRHVFDRAAMEAVGRYQFKPAMRGGMAVASSQQQRIEFSSGR